MAFINFNAEEHQSTSYDPLPAGDYLVYISESEIETTDQGNQKLSITMEVMQPEHFAGRKLFANFSLEHSNPKAVETGRRILANVCRAVGVMAPRDSEEMHNIPFFARTEVKQLDSGRVVNDCRVYWSTASQAPPHAKPKTPTAPQAPRPAQAGYMPQQPAKQAWQQPAPQAPQVPQQQYMNLQPQYRTGPIPVAPQPPAAAPGQPPWAQQPRPHAPAAPAPQQFAPPQQRQPGDDEEQIPF